VPTSVTGSAIAIGTFDGVHRGHREILSRLGAIADAQGLERVALAFELPPRCALDAGSERRCLLLPGALRVNLLEPFVDRVEWLRFEDVRRLPAAAFVRRVLVRRERAQAVVVGAAFRFGRGRRGDVRRLQRAFGAQAVTAVPELRIAGGKVSSSRIRERIAAGDIDTATLLLGRPPVLTGDVARAEWIDTRIDASTALLRVGERLLLPADGVYLVYVYGPDLEDDGLLYVGHGPTFADGNRRLELHLLRTPHHDLRAARLEIHLLRRLRDAAPRPDEDRLREALKGDVRGARLAISAGREIPARILG
jgi:riboflavin kinase/FMN adenylyltransferase